MMESMGGGDGKELHYETVMMRTEDSSRILRAGFHLFMVCGCCVASIIILLVLILLIGFRALCYECVMINLLNFVPKEFNWILGEVSGLFWRSDDWCSI